MFNSLLLKTEEDYASMLLLKLFIILT